jgi:hypothetical protein
MAMASHDRQVFSLLLCCLRGEEGFEDEFSDNSDLFGQEESV